MTIAVGVRSIGPRAPLVIDVTRFYRRLLPFKAANSNECMVVKDSTMPSTQQTLIATVYGQCWPSPSFLKQIKKTQPDRWEHILTLLIVSLTSSQ
ncbi:hypothetical protein LSAT2_022338 [Lamellibrachia satsuma]|nr:hypothetical protein LSAT2_022338 [Lamellibrachia satsuma]